MLSSPVRVAVDVPLVFFGADDEVLGARRQAESLSASSVRHEHPLLTDLHAGLHTWTAENNTHAELCFIDTRVVIVTPFF